MPRFPKSIELSSLTSTQGFTLGGSVASEWSGYSIAPLGDFNGDGFDDFAIGTNEDHAYVIYGGTDLGSLSLGNLDGSNGFVLRGPGTMSQVGGLGDVNDDGFPDAIFGADDAAYAGRGYCGAVYVVFGGTDVALSGEMQVSELDGSKGFIVYGSSVQDRFGSGVSGVGDFNGDGIDDILVSAYGARPDGRIRAGEAHLIYGASGIGASGSFDLLSVNGTTGFRIKGPKPDGYIGYHNLAGIGDFNLDGFPDFFVGSTYEGEGYVVFGGIDVGATGDFDLLDLDGSNGFVIDISPYGVSEVKGGSTPYFMIGADKGFIVRGRAGIGSSGYVVGSSLFISGGINGFTISGCGGGVGAGDINGDGFADFIIGNNNASPEGRTTAGAAYVVFGGPGVGDSGEISVDSLDGTNGFALYGVSASDRAGSKVSRVGDVNNDGIEDFAITAIWADPYGGRSKAGAVYVIYGDDGSLVPQLTQNTITLSEGETIVLSPFNFNATIAGGYDRSLISYSLDSIQFGQFERTATPGQAVASFLQGEIDAGEVVFIHDGGEDGPSIGAGVSYRLTMDGYYPTVVGFTNVNDTPQIIGTPVTGVATDVPYLYDFSVTDADLPGDVVSVSVTADGGLLPTWLVYEDLGSGNYRLSGIPTSGDATAGMQIDIMAQDDSGAATDTTHQLFDLSVVYPPVLLQNQLTIQEGATVLLTSSHLNATDLDTPDGSLLFQIQSLLRGTFSLISSGAVSSFTQQQIWDSDVQFQHDGSELVPVYDVQVSDGVGLSALQAANVTFIPVNDPPTLPTRSLTISEGGTVILSSSQIHATDPDTLDSDLTLFFTNVQQGIFSEVVFPGMPIGNTTQLAIDSSQVQFTHDGDEVAPSFDVAVTDGEYTDGPYSATISFTPLNDPPVITVNQLSVDEGQSVVLTTSNLNVSDVDSPGATFTFTVSSVQQGMFERVSVPSTEIFTFTLDEIIAGDIQFIHGGSEIEPSYTVTVSDGADNSVPSDAVITFRNNFNDRPLLINNRITVDEGQTVVLTTTDLSATDIDADDTTLIFTVSNVQYGHFERQSAVGIPITSFTQQEIIDGQISFVHGGEETAPSYQVSVSDGGLSTTPASVTVTFSANVNDMPQLVNNQLHVDQGGQKVLTSLDLSAIDVDDPGAVLVFDVSGVGHGYFELVSAFGTPITSFTSADIDAGEIRFVHDGSALPPSYQVTVSDGLLTSLPAAASIDFNYAPIIAVNQLMISQGERLVLTQLDLRADDINTTPENLTFTVSAVAHGQFELTANLGVAITRFTQVQVNTGKITFVHDDSEEAPSYSVRVDDGVLVSSTGLVDVTFINVNDAPVLMRPLDDASVEVDEQIKYEVPADTFEDPEGDLMSLSMRMVSGAPLPKGLTFISDTGTLSGVLESAGTYELEVEARDPLGLVASDQFDIVAKKGKGGGEEESDLLRNSLLISAAAALLGGVIGLVFFCVKRNISKHDEAKKIARQMAVFDDRAAGSGRVILVGEARRKHQEFIEHIVKPFAAVLAEELSLDSYMDFESPKGRKYVAAIEQLVTRLQKVALDIEKMSDEEQSEFIPKVMSAIIRYTVGGARKSSFWSKAKITPEMIVEVMDQIVDEVNRGYMPITMVDGAEAGAAVDAAAVAVTEAADTDAIELEAVAAAASDDALPLTRDILSEASTDLGTGEDEAGTDLAEGLVADDEVATDPALRV